MRSRFTAIIERDDDTYVAVCQELDIAIQERVLEEVREKLSEAIELFLASASPLEISHRWNTNHYSSSTS